MQLGMVGLGRMGSNMTRRLMRAGHQVAVSDLSADTVKQLAGEGAVSSSSLEDLVKKLSSPRAVWVMVPSGNATEQTVQKLAQFMQPGDTIIDGGNSYFKDDVRRAGELKSKSIHYVDVGTSGGVWGLERGYCMMIGGPDEAVQRLDPIFKTLAPGKGDISRTPGRRKTRRHRRRRLHPLRAIRFRPLREDGAQRNRIRHHAGLCRGLRHLQECHLQRLAGEHPLRFKPAGHCRGLAARQRDQFMASRSDCDGAYGKSHALGVRGLCAGFGRGPLDDSSGSRRSCSRRGADRGPVCAVPVAPAAYVRREDAFRHAAEIRRARGNWSCKEEYRISSAA